MTRPATSSPPGTTLSAYFYRVNRPVAPSKIMKICWRTSSPVIRTYIDLKIKLRNVQQNSDAFFSLAHTFFFFF